MPTSPYDVVVVGAGPAGLAAAAAATQKGSSVAVLDAAHQPGGQYWRHPSGNLAAVADLHHDLRTFRRLAAVTSRVDYLPGHQVWTIVRGADSFEVHALAHGGEVVVSGTTLVLAPGGYDRQLPFPGWDLPGVYTAGGAQALLKGHQVLAGRRIAVGGTGPFLLPVAAGLAARGAGVVGVYEANSPTGWVRHLPTVARAATKLTEGAGYTATLARRRVPFRPRHAIVAAHGDDAVQAVSVARLDREWNVVPGSTRVVECDAVAVGWGFTPQLELPVGLGADTHVDVDGSLVVTVDERQASSVPGVFVAGEATGVGGATLAVVEGEIAGLAAAARLGRSVDRPSRLLRRREALRAFAAAMHQTYPVRDGWRTWLDDETLVCRCEEVPVAAVTAAVRDLGATDARSVKLLSRAGMGWCQGRVCGYATACLTAAETGRPYDPTGLAERPLATPVPLDVLAADARFP